MIKEFQAWFVSDLHIKSDQDAKAIKFINWIESLGAETPATHLFLLGDIFDYWLGAKAEYQSYYPRIIGALSQLVERGVSVMYLEGNHDIHIKDFWQAKNISVYQADQMIKLTNIIIYVSHGDFINGRDLSYHRYIRWARGRWGRRLINCFSVKQWQSLGRWVSERSRRRSSFRAQKDQLQIKTDFMDFAYTCYHKNKFDYIVAGHIHQRIHQTLEPYRAQAINLGCWSEQGYPVLRINQQGLTWLDLKSLEND